MEFGEKLKALRLERGMTQTQVANYIGVTYQTCLSYEAGKSYPRRSGILTKLAELFDCDPEDLFNERKAFEARALRAYGTKGARHAEELVSQVSGMFAGGELSERDKDAIMEAIQEAYWIAKVNNKKFSPKKFEIEDPVTE